MSNQPGTMVIVWRVQMSFTHWVKLEPKCFAQTPPTPEAIVSWLFWTEPINDDVWVHTEE
jgi:hypothetical protein